MPTPKGPRLKRRRGTWRIDQSCNWKQKLENERAMGGGFGLTIARLLLCYNKGIVLSFKRGAPGIFAAPPPLTRIEAVNPTRQEWCTNTKLAASTLLPSIVPRWPHSVLATIQPKQVQTIFFRPSSIPPWKNLKLKQWTNRIRGFTQDYHRELNFYRCCLRSTAHHLMSLKLTTSCCTVYTQIQTMEFEKSKSHWTETS